MTPFLRFGQRHWAGRSPQSLSRRCLAPAKGARSRRRATQATPWSPQAARHFVFLKGGLQPEPGPLTAVFSLDFFPVVCLFFSPLLFPLSSLFSASSQRFIAHQTWPGGRRVPEA